MMQLLSLLVAVFALLGSGCTPPPEPIRIGFIGGLSGRVSDLGTGGLQGVRLAVEMRNRNGGIKGRQIALLEADDQQDPETAMKAFDKLIGNGVVTVIGPMTSEITKAILPRANARRLLLLSPTASTNDLSGLDDYFFRIFPSTRHFVQAVADYYFKEKSLRRIRLVYDLDNRSYTESWVGDFRQAIEGNGGTLLKPISFTSGDGTNFLDLARRALEGKPQAIIAVSNSVDAAMLFQGIRKLDGTVHLGTSGWAGTERLAELGGKWAEGALVAHAFDRNSRQQGYLDFRAAYHKRFNREPGFAELFGFDAANVVLEALERQLPGQSLKETLQKQRTFQAAQSVIAFDDFGDVQGSIMMLVIRDGRFIPLTN